MPQQMVLIEYSRGFLLIVSLVITHVCVCSEITNRGTLSKTKGQLKKNFIVYHFHLQYTCYLMKKWLKTLYVDLSALVLGALLAFAFAPYEVFPFAVICPAGLLALWLKESPQRASWLGFTFGLGYFGAGVYWVFHSIHVFGNVPTIVAGLITSALIMALALFPAAVGYTVNRYFPVNNTAKLVYAFPAIWLFSEWIRSWLCTGFPWLFLGYSQTNSPLKGFAPIFSVYGVSFAVLLTSALLVNAVLQLRQKAYRTAYLSLFAITVIWVTGGLCNLIPWTQPTGQPLSVALIQGNIPQSLKWSPDHIQLSFDRYEKLTEPLWGKDKLIIWPEAAIPMPLSQASGFINIMDDKAKLTGSQLILGIPIATPDRQGYYNGAVTLGEHNEVYLKRRLVPFGEYIPSIQFLPRLFNFMNIPLSDMVAGRPDKYHSLNCRCQLRCV
ncbi:MAG: apolipoprotein N-acyltransferase [Gammaproteobacteria bacterium]|nr:MAG: apolipoprotein N-acyltransferase [Gammaproteobacteria bacterium]